jgi:tetratricopeptide (TPR) repeat protein
MSDFDSIDEIEEQLDGIQDAAGDLIEPCKYKSSFERYGELRRLARGERRLGHYLNGVFFQMDQAQYLLDFATMRERAIELVSLLESEERARQLQADFEPHHYEYLVHSMTSCAYENLAEGTGQLDGYNSEGMHACIADGLRVCRQTGKLACISCFREYSVDVYTSADDTELARYQCQLVIDHPGPWSDRGDRRWLASIKAAWLEMLNGKLGAAGALIEQAYELIESEEVSLKREAAIRILFYDMTRRLLCGEDISKQRERVAGLMPPSGECPFFELQAAQVESLAAVVNGEYAKAVEILTPWDKRLSQDGANHQWFEVRLRIIAAQRLAGETDRLSRLAEPLEKKAQEASDWLTERRLQRLLDEDFAAAPVPLVAKLRLPSAEATETKEDDAQEDDAKKTAPLEQAETQPSAYSDDTIQVTEEDTDTPLAEVLDAIYAEIDSAFEAEDMEKIGGILDQIVAYQAGDVEHPADAGRLIYYASFLPMEGRAQDVWQWANSLANAHEGHARTISVLGSIGLAIRSMEDEPFAETITSERLEQLYRKSLQLDGTVANNFQRAGDFYLEEENYGEAERCFARAFRLDRTSAPIALRLAEVYKMTDRRGDALNVLDLCLRNGCDDPSVTWQAGLVAFMMNRYEATLTYLERFDEQLERDPKTVWVNYYRSVALYELGQFREAFDAIEEEKRRVEMDALHIAATRACIRLALGKMEAEEDLEAFLAIPLHEVDYLAPPVIEDTLVRAWNACNEYLASADVCDALEERLLGAGLMPDDYFEDLRQQNTKKRGLNFFRCMVQQPLDDRWRMSAYCLEDQVDWPFYLADWGVLAADEDEALGRVLKFQSRCYHLPAEVLGVQASEDDYEDRPGVVWQGFRIPGSFDDMDEDDMDEDVDDDTFDSL